MADSFETVWSDEEDLSVDFWNDRQIGRVAAPFIRRNTRVTEVKGRIVDAAEVTKNTNEQQGSAS